MTGKRNLMPLLGIAALLLVLVSVPVQSADGVVLVPSAQDVKTTTDRLQKALTEKGYNILARIDHAAAAKTIGQSLRPAEVLIFGNPKLGIPLIQKNAQLGLDLPTRALVYQGEDGKTYLAYNDPAFLFKRYGVTEPASVIKEMTSVLKEITAAVAK